MSDVLHPLPPTESEGQRIADEERVRNFLNDDAVKRALSSLNRQYFDEFKASTSPAERESAWAKARVLDDLGNALQTVLDVGKIAKHTRAQREQQEELQRKRAEKQRPSR